MVSATCYVVILTICVVMLKYLLKVTAHVSSKIVQSDFSWSCGNCMVPEPWETFQNPPLGGSHPNTPRNGCRPGACANTRVYPNFPPNKNTPRTPRQVRNLPWAPNFPEDRFKGQRCRNGTAPYW
ncbi:hypothetical protein RR46_10391 [Papilio xuthus]|uniref:Uncharacterized protein n=1 Tax=Papilio xuthus TaxID=66420 RepID=A0A194Q175_PAPXU|nr:hypothetical protein RR46_10391 [Papilio xuthus]